VASRRAGRPSPEIDGETTALREEVDQRHRFRPTSLRTYLLTLVVATALSLGLTFSHPTMMRVDGQRVLTDVAPVTVVHETFLPLRAVGSALGATTSYDERTGRIEIIRGRDTIILRVGERRATLNGAVFTLSHAPFLVRKRLLVPAHLFDRALRSTIHDDSGESIEVLSR